MPETQPQAVQALCEAFDHDSDEPCRIEAVITVTVGCVHEHLGERSACQSDVEALANGTICCRTCLAIDGHHCEMVLLAGVEANA